MEKKRGHKKALWIVLLSAVLVLALAFILYHSVYYHADIREALDSADPAGIAFKSLKRI